MKGRTEAYLGDADPVAVKPHQKLSRRLPELRLRLEELIAKIKVKPIVSVRVALGHRREHPFACGLVGGWVIYRNSTSSQHFPEVSSRGWHGDSALFGSRKHEIFGEGAIQVEMELTFGKLLSDFESGRHWTQFFERCAVSVAMSEAYDLIMSRSKVRPQIFEMGHDPNC